MRITLLFVVLASAFVPEADACTQPPFGGTIFVDPDIVVPSDPSELAGLADAGRGSRTMFDRRTNSWVTVVAYLFDVEWVDGSRSEVQVNPEFGSVGAARVEAETYAWAVGQLPRTLRRDVDAIWIHRGVEPFGGGNRSILIHTGQADAYVRDGILEETLIHEASHTSLDADHANAPGWLAAQTSDACFISTYARDFSSREDVAESFLIYVALKYARDRIGADLIETCRDAIPHRIAYFDAQRFDMTPMQRGPVANGERSWGAIKARF